MSTASTYAAVVENVRTLFADCATFQTLTGADDATEAYAFTEFYKQDAADYARPVALIFPPQIDDERTGAQAFRSGGVVEILLEFNDPEPEEGEEEGFNVALEAHTIADKIRVEMIELSGNARSDSEATSTHIQIASLVTKLNRESSDSEAVHYYQFKYILGWGPG